jgi:CMP-N-acetylneuraminic acid synthetase
MRKIGVFIPGRLSSERLPNKLILPLGESNLWDMACRKLNDLPDEYNKYALCSDWQLMEIAEKYPNITVIERDEDTAKAEGPLQYIFRGMRDVEDTHLMFLNPCLSFLKGDTILRALEEFDRSGADYATSVKPLQNWLFDEDGDNINKIDYERLTTKEIRPIYQAAHCFHIFKREDFFNDGMMLKPGLQMIKIPHEETIDVDTKEDYEYAKFKHRKKFVIDIDGVICESEGLLYEMAKPRPDVIKKINKLYEAGNTIWFQTARGYVTGNDHKALTEAQLEKWGVKYHKLLMGKPDADYYIDDKAVNIKDWI